MDIDIVFFGFITIGKYGKCYQPTALHERRGNAEHARTTRHHHYVTAHDRQPRQPVMVNDIATLVRRALAEACTVPLLLHCVHEKKAP